MSSAGTYAATDTHLSPLSITHKCKAKATTLQEAQSHTAQVAPPPHTHRVAEAALYTGKSPGWRVSNTTQQPRWPSAACQALSFLICQMGTRVPTLLASGAAVRQKAK